MNETYQGLEPVQIDSSGQEPMFTIKRILLAFIPICSLLVGFLEYGPARDTRYVGTLTTAQAVTTILLIFLWFRHDAYERRYPSSRFFNIALLGLTIFVLPYYFFRSRGIAGGFKTLLLSLLVFVIVMAAYRAGAWLAQPDLF